MSEHRKLNQEDPAVSRHSAQEPQGRHNPHETGFQLLKLLRTLAGVSLGLWILAAVLLFWLAFIEPERINGGKFQELGEILVRSLLVLASVLTAIQLAFFVLLRRQTRRRQLGQPLSAVLLLMYGIFCFALVVIIFITAWPNLGSLLIYWLPLVLLFGIQALIANRLAITALRTAG